MSTAEVKKAKKVMGARGCLELQCPNCQCNIRWQKPKRTGEITEYNKFVQYAFKQPACQAIPNSERLAWIGAQWLASDKNPKNQ